jgi:Acetoacetate decarboxylase (ADC)
MRAPGAPWALRGECLVAVCPRAGPAGLPPGIDRLPGPSVLVAARYTDSPVGPYLEVAVACPARVGPRPGLCVTTMVVDSSDSRAGGRHNWGFPKELTTLHWSTQSGSTSLRLAGGLEIRGRPHGPALPLALPLWCLQLRVDGPVIVLGWMRGRFRPATVDVNVPAGDPLAALAGRQRGFRVTGLHLVMGPARRAGPRAPGGRPVQ